MINKGQFRQTRAGQFLASLKERFSPEVIFDMYCFISLYLELSIKAKRNKGFYSNNQNAITQLEQFRKTLEETRASILLAHTAVKKISGNNAAVVTEAINNANISIALINYNDNAIIHFTEALARFIKSGEPRWRPIY
jgi:hypothetical protein